MDAGTLALGGGALNQVPIPLALSMAVLLWPYFQNSFCHKDSKLRQGVCVIHCNISYAKHRA